MLTIYRAPASTNCQRVDMALMHKGLEATSVVISYEDRSPVEAISGQPLVPVLVDDDEVIADSMVIVAHLEARFPDPPLYPPDRARRAELEVFVDWFNRVWKLAPNLLAGELERAAPDSAAIARHAATLDAHLDVFEALLDGRDFLFGAFSAADCCAYPFLKYAAGRPDGDDELFHVVLEERQSLDGRPHLAAWIDRVAPLAPVH